MAEDLTDYLAENEVRVLHSEIHSIERIEIIQDLRLGEYDVLVGVNLRRRPGSAGEPGGDSRCRQRGFLRAERSLIQTISRAARHVEGVAPTCRQHDRLDGQGHLETERRRAIQQAYSLKHGVVPTAAGKKAIRSSASWS